MLTHFLVGMMVLSLIRVVVVVIVVVLSHDTSNGLDTEGQQKRGCHIQKEQMSCSLLASRTPPRSTINTFFSSPTLLVNTVGDGSGGGFIDDTKHVKALRSRQYP